MGSGRRNRDRAEKQRPGTTARRDVYGYIYISIYMRVRMVNGVVISEGVGSCCRWRVDVVTAVVVVVVTNLGGD
jgi:hypothetical protein